MVRDYAQCKERRVVSPPDQYHVQGYNECGLIRSACGWYTLITNGVCDQCARLGEADPSNPKIRDLVSRLKRALVRGVNHAHYPPERSPEAVFRELHAAGDFRSDEDALDLLDQAVRGGLAPKQADAIAESLKIGEADGKVSATV